MYSSLNKFKNRLEETDPVLRNMDENVPQKLNDDRDRSDQRYQEMEGSLGLEFQAIKEMEVKIEELSINKAREEPKKAPIVIMEDNLTKAKRALIHGAILDSILDSILLFISGSPTRDFHPDITNGLGSGCPARMPRTFSLWVFT